MKMSIAVDDLCKGFPAEFAIYLRYCRTLQFEDTPAYLTVFHAFQNLLHGQLQLQYDYMFDWVIIQQTADRGSQEGTI